MNTQGDKREIRRFKKGLYYVLFFTGVLWLIKIFEVLQGGSLAKYGIEPRTPEGIIGILMAPLIHGNYLHLFSNSPPLVILGSGIIYLFPRASIRTLAMIYLLGGLGVWIFARPVHHIGASGLIYGVACFIFFSGILRRDPQSIALALIVTFLYGGMIWGVLPLELGVSWESHLSGAIVGSACSLLFRNLDRPPVPDFIEDDDLDEYDDQEEFREPYGFFVTPEIGQVCKIKDAEKVRHHPVIWSIRNNLRTVLKAA